MIGSVSINPSESESPCVGRRVPCRSGTLYFSLSLSITRINSPNRLLEGATYMRGKRQDGSLYLCLDALSGDAREMYETVAHRAGLKEDYAASGMVASTLPQVPHELSSDLQLTFARVSEEDWAPDFRRPDKPGKRLFDQCRQKRVPTLPFLDRRGVYFCRLLWGQAGLLRGGDRKPGQPLRFARSDASRQRTTRVCQRCGAPCIGGSEPAHRHQAICLARIDGRCSCLRAARICAGSTFFGSEALSWNSGVIG